jgi:predicted transcriptional regulator
MSIRPEFASKILAGEKTVEFRKTAFRRNVTHVLIYSTTPIGALVGICAVDGVSVASPGYLWRKYSAVAGIDRTGYSDYYSDRERAVAIRVSSVQRFDAPLPLSAVGEQRPPQSFRYLDDVDLHQLLRAGQAAAAQRLVRSNSA